MLLQWIYIKLNYGMNEQRNRGIVRGSYGSK